MGKVKLKSKQIRKPKLLPYVSAAVICEKTLQEQDKVVSVMRIIDTIGVAAPEYDTEAMKSAKEGKPLLVTTNLTLFLCFRRGEVTDNLHSQINIITPKGTVHERLVYGDLQFKIDHNPGYGINMFVPVHLVWEGVGLYWFEVQVDGKTITKVPLVVKDSTKEQPRKVERA